MNSERKKHWELAENAIRRQIGAVDFMTVDEIRLVTGWSETMCVEAAMKRLSDTDPDDAMFATGITEIFEDGDLARLDRRGALTRVARETPRTEPIDLFADLAAEQAALEERVARGELEMPGVIHRLDVRAGDIDDVKAGNIFANGTRAAYVQQDEIELSIPHWLSTRAELAYYGFALLEAGQTLVVRSPIGVAPIIPLYVGTSYNRNIRNGYYIESHGGTGPVHFWAPMQAECEGYVTAAKFLGLDQDGFQRFSFARIKIPLATMLVCDATAWHCDGTLSGGVHTTTFGFRKGPRGDVDHDIITLQPLRTRGGDEIAPPRDRLREELAGALRG